VACAAAAVAVSGAAAEPRGSRSSPDPESVATATRRQVGGGARPSSGDPSGLENSGFPTTISNSEPAMDRPVMRSAQQDEIRDGGLAAVRPVPNVVGIAPPRRAIAAREAASSVAHGDGPTQRRRHDLGPAAEVERFRARVDEHPRDVRVARDAPRGLRCDRAGILECRAPRTALERVEVRRNEDVRHLATDLRPLERREPASAHCPSEGRRRSNSIRWRPRSASRTRNAPSISSMSVANPASESPASGPRYGVRRARSAVRS
jgi:hypothetical protein